MIRILFLGCFALLLNSSFAQTIKELSIPMFDGTSLAADLYIPPNQTKGNTILMRTPYQKEGMEPIAKRFAQEGFFVVVQDVRGKYSSKGKFIPFLNEQKDGEASLNWISEQAWCNGNIGLWGSSYLGYSALILSASPNPHLKSIFHISGWLDGTEVNTQGGAFHQSLVIPWLVFEGQRSRKNVSKMDMNELLSHVPTADIIPSFYFKNEQGDSVHLSKLSTSNATFPFQKSNVPIFHLTGWYDFVLPGVLSAHKQFSTKASGQQYLKIGPWHHNQAYGGAPTVGTYELPPQGFIDLEKLISLSVDWFNQSLNNEPIQLPKVEFYVLFKDQWISSNSWPVKNSTPATYYLEDHKLLGSMSTTGTCSYQYDPNKPVPTWGGANFHFFMDEMGMREQTKIEQRDDVLTFTTSPFSNNKTFAGPISLDFYYQTEAKGTDFTAKLALVDKNGKSWNVSDGIIRVTASTKKINRATIKLNDVAFQVKEGEQLRLQISSSNFPKFNRNPNTGEDPIEATFFKSVKQTIYYGKHYPTKIQLYEIQN